jgi:integrase/recombinase XerD
LIEGYLAYLLDVGRKSPRTVIDVRCSLRRAVASMQTIRPDTDLWKLSLEDYLRWIEQQRSGGCSAGSLSKFLSHLRGLLDYAWRSGRSDRNVLDGFNLADEPAPHAPNVLTIQEAARLVAACPKETPLDRRDRMIVLLLYGCGLRTDELCRVQVDDVDRDRRELFVRHGKGDRQRVVPVPEGVYPEVLAYLLDRGGKRGPLLRTTAKRHRLSAKDICRVASQAAQRANIEREVTPRTLRHSYATHLMDRGVDLAVISSLMGHRSPTETGVYLHALGDRTRQAVRRLPGHGEGSQP